MQPPVELYQMLTVIKKKKKIEEFVSSNGDISFFLDIFTAKLRVVRSLKIQNDNTKNRFCRIRAVE